MPTRNFNPPEDHLEERRVAGEWFDGANSAMRAFSRYQPFSPEKLLRETRQAIALVTQEDILSGDAARLQSLYRLAEGWQKHIQAVLAFRKACKRCKELGVDGYQINKVYEEFFG